MSENKQISFKEIINLFKQIILLGIKKWKVITAAGIMGTTIGFLIAQFSSPVYKAKLSFLLNENEPAANLNLSSLAGLAGFSGFGASTNVSEDKLIFLVTSRSLMGNTLLIEADIDHHKDLLVNHFIDKYNFTKVFKSDTALEEFTYIQNKTLKTLNYKENKALDLIIKFINDKKNLSIEVKKKGGIVAQWAGIVLLEFKSKNEEFSKVFMDNLYINLSDFYTNKTIRKQEKNYHLIKLRADSIQNLLFDKEEYGAEVYDRNLKTIRMKGQIEVQRTRRDVEMLNLMYGEVLKNLEMAKFTLDNQTPVFQIIDNPTYPLEKKKMSRLIAGIAGGFIFGLFTCLFISVSYYYKNETTN